MMNYVNLYETPKVRVENENQTMKPKEKVPITERDIETAES